MNVAGGVMAISPEGLGDIQPPAPPSLGFESYPCSADRPVQRTKGTACFRTRRPGNVGSVSGRPGYPDTGRRFRRDSGQVLPIVRGGRLHARMIYAWTNACSRWTSLSSAFP